MTNNDSDERIYLEGLSCIIFEPFLIGFIIILLMASAGCILRYIDGM